jgi:hypothetical protein
MVVRSFIFEELREELANLGSPFVQRLAAFGSRAVKPTRLSTTPFFE